MKKFVLLMCMGIAYADVPVTNTTDMTSTYQVSAVHLDAMQNLDSLIAAVNKAQNVQNQISALKQLNNFTSDPANATDQVNGVVSNMLNDFNLKSGTSYGNLQELIGSLSSSTTATGMSLKLQQSSATQLQNISVMLQQMEAENQAIIKYKQAEIALKNKQAQEAKKQEKEISDSL